MESEIRAEIKYFNENELFVVPLSYIKEYTDEGQNLESDFCPEKYYNILCRNEHHPKGIYLPAKILSLSSKLTYFI